MDVALVAVVGVSPAVVTETLYALCVERDPPEPITRVDLVGTTRSRNEYAKHLAGKKGALARLAEVYGLSPFRSKFHVLRAASGTPLDDVRTSADNEVVARQVYNIVKRLAGKTNVLHGSLAGGRKTLGYSLAMAFQLLARPQDRLYHVLVPEEQEKDPEFFFPVPGQRIRMDLAEIPFLRARQLAPEDLRRGDPHRLLDAVQARVDEQAVPILEILLDEAGAVARIEVSGRLVWPIPGLHMRGPDAELWRWFADLRTRCRSGGAEACACCFREAADVLWRPEYEPEFVKEASSRIAANLRVAGFSAEAVDQLRFRGFGRRPNRVYGIALAPERIRIKTARNVSVAGRRASFDDNERRHTRGRR